MRYLGRLAAGMVVAVTLLGCGDDPTAAEAPRVDRIDMELADETMTVGDTVRVMAAARAADGTTLTNTVTWSSENESMARVHARTSTGVAVVEARAPGAARIIASAGGRESSLLVTIVPKVVALRVVADSTVLHVGDFLSFEAVPLAGDSSVVGGASVAWSSGASGLASVTAQENGRLAQVWAHSPGEVEIRAETGGVHATVSVRVLPRPVPAGSIVLAPRDTTVEAGAELSMRAVVYGADNSVIDRPVQWVSTEPRVATVDASGRVTAHESGYTLIQARADGVVVQTELQVRFPEASVGHVVLTPVTRGLWVGMTHAFGATVKVLGTGGQVLEGRSVGWHSEDPTVASIDDAGKVRALKAGRTRVRGVSGGVSGFATVVVYELPGAVATYDLTWDWWDGAIHLAPSVGTETVRDEDGAEHVVNVHLTGGSLTFDDTGTGMAYRRTLRIQGWRRVGDELLTVVDRELVDEGNVGIIVGGESGYNLVSTTTPGLQYQAVVAYNAGHLVVREVVGSAPLQEYLYRLRP